MYVISKSLGNTSANGTSVFDFEPVINASLMEADVIAIFEGVKLKIKSKLMMVGEGPEKVRAIQYVKEKGLEGQVLFLGNSNEIDKILCYSDLFLLPS